MVTENKTEFQVLKEQKTAGDELDRLAGEMAARDGIAYVQAFRRVSILNPELVKQYRGV